MDRPLTINHFQLFFVWFTSYIKFEDHSIVKCLELLHVLCVYLVRLAPQCRAFSSYCEVWLVAYLMEYYCGSYSKLLVALDVQNSKLQFELSTLWLG